MKHRYTEAESQSGFRDLRAYAAFALLLLSFAIQYSCSLQVIVCRGTAQTSIVAWVGPR